MKDVKQREWFYSQDKTQYELLVPAPYEIYKLRATKQTVCEYTLDLGLGDSGCEIAVMGDTHFNLSLPEDDLDEETVYTKFKRLWGKGGAHVDRTRLSLQAADFSDQIILVGDIIDYLTKGAMMLTKKYIVDAYPDVLMTVAHHDMTKQMQTGRPNLLSNDERLAILQEIWPNDIHFATRDLTDKITVVCLGHTLVKYTSDISDRLAAEIDRARAEGRYLLIFQHEPLSTGVEKDREAWACFDRNKKEPISFNCYDDKMRICKPDDTDEVNWKVYKLITTSADVIKGIFVGHEHIQTYTEIPATYESEGKTVRTVIPQHVVACTAYYPEGYYMRVIVK